MKTLALLCTCLLSASLLAHQFNAQNADALKAALRKAKPGDVIKLAPGTYEGGLWIEKANGAAGKPILIEGDANAMSTFSGGNEALHFADCNHLTLRNVKVSGQTGNGVNADDGGHFEIPSKGMVFENVTIENIGPKGNHDALKLSGLDTFTVRNCAFSGWGGSAIDMVGCHDGVIETCTFLGKPGFSQDTGVQAKGGCENILIKKCFFKAAGQRAINLGGSTDLQFFRPGLRDYEAKKIEAAGNTFVGSQAPVAYVTSIACDVHHNTFVNPEKWVMRILQEQPIDQFKPCQQGRFDSNLIVFDRRVTTFVNVGPDTKPETFVFERNAWFCSDGNRTPLLPTKEIQGLYHVDPKLQKAGTSEMTLTSTDPRLKLVGAHAFKD